MRSDVAATSGINLNLTKFTTENTSKLFDRLYQSIGYVLNEPELAGWVVELASARSLVR